MLAWCCALWTLLGCARSEASGSRSGPFNGQAALGYAKAQVDFGPRVPGTDAHRLAGDWIVARMRERADTVIEQTWTHRTAAGRDLPMRNVLARFRPDVAERILYVTHWDSRPTSDSETNDALRMQAVPGANDGASGVGLFVALGDVLKKTPPSVGVDLLFVDGEDYGNFDKNEDVLIGSRYFAEHLPAANYQILFGVLWDMIGDADLQVYQETHSLERAPEVVSRVWQTAADLGYSRWFIPESRYTVTDDHLPLLDKGLRVIDVIDLDYPAHHTTRDTIDRVSANSLKIVGDVAYALVR
ncbi:MAG: hypothetical protein MNPFHGCM_02562 [Gemmatimonadaceae bacterium]|nr:hypothetical protein [Gemmatimonadaceae bacterium]